ncbi:MAG: hotdog domain-containing protein [Candidatus Neomarinimicrobiota bacterium]|nr:hotdog domain-containing protein [Candidatus Neomarinimicrobiota bacterium]
MGQITARFSQLVMPNDLNNIGTLFGGKMVSWMDISAAKAGQRFLQKTEAAGCVTKAIDEVIFSEPVFGGEWVNFEAAVRSAGESSLTVSVLARAENNKGEARNVCEAVFTMVAVRKGNDGRWEKVAHGKSLD